MNVQIVYLHAADDIDSTRDKLGWVQVPRALLVWPDRGRILFERFALVKLLRMARKRNIQIGLLTFDPDVRQIARELNVPVFDSLDHLPEERWEQYATRDEGFYDQYLSRSLKRPSLSVRENIPKWAEEIGHRPIRIPRASLLITVMFLIVLVVPSAEIVLSPRLNLAQDSFMVGLDWGNGSSQEGLRLEAEKVEMELAGHRSSPTSGWLEVPETHAQGVVEFTNHTPDPVRIPFNTIVRTEGSNPVRFRTSNTVRLPAGIGSQVEAPVEAVEPGELANIPANSISAIEGQLGLVLSVRNPTAMTGGSVGLVPMPAESDFERLDRDMRAALIKRATREISAQFGEGKNLLEDGVWITEVIEYDFSHDVGDAGENLELEMRVNLAGLVYDRRDLEDLVVDYVSRSMAQEREIALAYLKYDMNREISSSEQDLWALRIEARYHSYPSIEVSELRGMIWARTPSRVRSILQEAIPTLEEIEMTIFPDWMPVFPLWGERIQFRFDWE